MGGIHLDVEAIVRLISERLDGSVLFIGGVAVQAFADYRTTHDIDLIIREKNLYLLKGLLKEAGFLYSRSPHLEKHIFKHRDRGEVDAYTERVGDVRVDEPFFKNAVEVEYAGIPILVPCLEDILILKVSAGRDMDIEDVAVLIFQHRGEIDAQTLEQNVGIDPLRRIALLLPEHLPMEYGWTARKELKDWLSERGWL
ncbi:MAG: nucleotidyltransferase [Thermoplasmata archaeon]